MIQPTCPWCEMGFYRDQSESGHVEGFQEMGRCGSKWFPDFEGGHVDGRKQSEACKEISALRAQITEMQSNASTAAFEKVNDQLAEANRENANLRAQVATLSAGKAWIPEPADEDLKESFRASKVLAWAREHAVAPVAVPELTSEWCDEIWRNAPRGVPVWDAIKWVIEQDRKRIHPIPADRILQDGQVAVDRNLLAEYEALYSEFRRPTSMSRLLDSVGKIDALRAKKEGGQE